MMSRRVNRRQLLSATGGLIATTILAGCSNGENGDDGGNGDNGVPQAIDNHLSDANEYDGSISDTTGEQEVTVDVGTGDRGYGFSPPALRVDAGTTVVWEWTGNGGQHNVSSVDGSDVEFQSDYMETEGDTFTQTFDDPGIALYQCDPHAGQGMLGAVEIVE